jgi:calpain, invertebrate
MRSNETNEFWSALLEKAYAKLHGSYSALRGGTTCEAMVDFSGGCSEQYDLNSKKNDVYDIMMKGYARSSMMACSVEPDRFVFEAKTKSGLVRGHAYSLTKVVKANIDTGRKKGTFPLVRIRNPWGNDTEWKGAWSDQSLEWQFIPDDEREKLGITFDADGEFFMSERDFMKQFDTLEVCNLEPESLDEEELSVGKVYWHEKQFTGSWIAGQTAGGCRNYINSYASNPQFKVVLTDSDEDSDELCTCVISLMQKGSRKKKAIKGEGCITIGRFLLIY